MRNIKKSIMVKTIQRTVYDRVSKIEKTTTFEVSEVSEMPELELNCILVEDKIIKEEEKTYCMKPSDFVKYATIVDNKTEQ